MASVTQDMLYRQSVMRYTEKNGQSAAGVFFKRTRQWVHYWFKRYDGTIESLKQQSRRPHSHPNQHTDAELKLIQDTRKRNPNEGLTDFWVRLRLKGYRRYPASLYRVMIRLNLFAERNAKKPPKYVPKPYEQMKYPGQRVQVDVKHVPKECCKGLAEGEKLYQFTAIDEYTRQRYLEGFNELSSYSAARFILNVQAAFRYKIYCVQTDNGPEFTKRFSDKRGTLTMFQRILKDMGIEHKLIRPFTPRHNGKVERSHRKDNERFYLKHSFHSLQDFNNQLKQYLNAYNDFPMRPLDWLSPNQMLDAFISSLVKYV